jgi:hypothetical protein
MLNKLIDKIGDRNPQLFRELRSRLTGNSLIAMVIISISIQVIGIGLFIADDSLFNDKIHSNFNFLNSILPISLMLGGVYTIVSDLQQEDRSGTFDFIRLTPQSARSIFLGKILGVPSLIYLGVLLTVPLHIVVGMFAGASLAMMVGWYCTMAVTTYLCLSFVILYILYGGKHAILLTLFFSIPINTFVGFYNFCSNLVIVEQSDVDSNNEILFSWFYLPISNNIFGYDIFIICTFLAISYWLWITIDRKYINLTNTSFKKADSYWMNMQFQLWLLGCAFPIVAHSSVDRSNQAFSILAVFYSISAIWIYTLVALILPNKQTIQDWSREHFTHRDRHQDKQALIQDLIWHDRSPIILAMLVNLIIPAIVWGLGFVIFIDDLDLIIKSICGIIVVSILTLMHSIVINFICLRSSTKNTVIIPLIFLMSSLPVYMSFIGFMNPAYKDLSTIVLMFSPFAWISVTQLSLLNIGMIMMGQIGILAGLTQLFQRRVYKLGASDIQSIDQQKSSLARTNI